MNAVPDDAAVSLSFFTRALSDSEAEALRISLSPTSLLALVRTRDDVVAWVRPTDPAHPALVGWGRALTLSARGTDRMQALRSQWRTVVGAAQWSDPLVRPGTGPVALGTIAFSEHSATESVLIVPEVLVGRDAEGAWVTVARAAGSEGTNTVDAAPETGDAAPAGEDQREPESNAAASTPDWDAVLAELHEMAEAGRAAEAAHVANSQPGDAKPPQAAKSDHPSATISEGELSESNYLTAVEAVQGPLRAGEVEKVVIARDEYVTPDEPLPTGTLLERLARAYPQTWTFAVDGMVGASPELLLRMHGRRYVSRVLAGTARRKATDPDERDNEALELMAWLESSPKNNREHQLARDSAIRALEPLSSVVDAPARRVLTLPNVLHLASDISGVVASDIGVLALLDVLHPTAAVGGTPTDAALELIEGHEGMDRGRYAGPVGWVDWHGEGEWCIALRSGQSDGKIGPEHPVRIFGGGGIMPDSDPVDELAETGAKMRPMREALGA